MSTAKIEFKTRFGERVSYGLYFSGQLFFLQFGNHLSGPVFYRHRHTHLTVAGITLIVKVWDAVNDPIFGGIIDKIHFPKGKFLPWIRIAVVAIPLSTIFLFGAASSLPLTAKILWVIVGYMLWDTAYTICDVPIFGLVTTMTDQEEKI